MAEITSKRRGELVRGVFEALIDKPDGLPAAQALWVQHTQGLPDADRRRLPLKPVYFLASTAE